MSSKTRWVKAKPEDYEKPILIVNGHKLQVYWAIGVWEDVLIEEEK